MVDKVFPNRGGRQAGRMGEEQQEGAGGEGSPGSEPPAHTLLSQAGEPRGPGPGSTPHGVAYPLVSSPAQGLRC